MWFATREPSSPKVSATLTVIQRAATYRSEINFNELKAPCDATVVGDCTGLEAPYDDKLGEQEPAPHPAPDFFGDSLLITFSKSSGCSRNGDFTTNKSSRWPARQEMVRYGARKLGFVPGRRNA